jgi:hypothetical protein
LLKANAAIFIFQRERDEEGYALCNAQDFEDVLNDFKDLAAPSFLGVSGDAFMLYKALSNRERNAELTFEDVALEAKQTFGGETPENTLREYYIRALVDAGLLHEEQFAADKRRKMYTVVPRDLTKLSVFDDEKAVLEAVKTGSDYDTRNNSTGNSTTSLTTPNDEMPCTQPMLHDLSLRANSKPVSDTNDCLTDPH